MEHTPTQEPPPEETAASEEPRQPAPSVWTSMTPSAWNTWLVTALKCVDPLVWGPHQEPIIRKQAAGGLRPPLARDIPLLFQRVGDLTNIAARIESVLLKAAFDPVLFAKALDSLVDPTLKLIAHPQLDAPQVSRLWRLLMTAIAIAHQQGITRDDQLINALAVLVMQYKDVLPPDEYCMLLSDIEAAWQHHALKPGPLLEALRSTREKLETIAVVADHLPRNPRQMDTASLQEKKDYLEALISQPPPCGPIFIAQWSWVAHHWKEPELRFHIVDGISQWLLEASKGVGEHSAFQGAFLFDLLPQEVLQSAFYLTGSPDNGKLLQVKPLTERTQVLLNHYLLNEDIPDTQRQRLRDWHGLS